MARRGTPLPFQQRETIRRLAAGGCTRRQIAAAVGVSLETAVKYARRSSERNAKNALQ